MIAGAVSFTLMSLGFTLVAIPLVIAILGAFLGTLFGWLAARNPGDFSMDGVVGRDVITRMVSDAWSTFAPWLIGMLVVGVIIWIVGYLSSIWILRSHDVNRRVGVTWAGLGIAIVANVLISGVASPLSGMGGMFNYNVGEMDGFGSGDFGGFGDIPIAPIVAFGVIVAIVGILANAVIGLFSWWWMAHALRDRPTADAAPAPLP